PCGHSPGISQPNRTGEGDANDRDRGEDRQSYAEGRPGIAILALLAPIRADPRPSKNWPALLAYPHGKTDGPSAPPHTPGPRPAETDGARRRARSDLSLAAARGGRRGRRAAAHPDPARPARRHDRGERRPPGGHRPAGGLPRSEGLR